MKPASLCFQPGRTRAAAHPQRAWALLVCSALLIFSSFRSAAVVPIPDAIIYGTIALQNRAVTNGLANTNVVVQATRVSDGQVLASYAMGSSTTQGPFFYTLRIPMEDSPASSTQVAQSGDLFTITVTTYGAVQFAVTNIPPISGIARRLDFGASIATSGDGIPDAWKLAHVLTLDSDGDGVPDITEFIAGTNPYDSNDVFRITIENLECGTNQISFLARMAQGQDYVGLTRYYTLESTTNPVAGSWTAVPGYERIPGTDQMIAYTASTQAAGSGAFFRGRVWLEGLTPGTDANGDGVPDSWELAQMNNRPGLLTSYIAGTDPNNPLDVFNVDIETTTNGVIQVGFQTASAQGSGYEGRSRYYALETSTNLQTGGWSSVTNFSRILGANQAVTYMSAPGLASSPVFFRARVWLEGP